MSEITHFDPGFKENMVGEESFTPDKRSISDVKKARGNFEVNDPRNLEHAIDILQSLKDDATFIDENPEGSDVLMKAIGHLKKQLEDKK